METARHTYSHQPRSRKLQRNSRLRAMAERPVVETEASGHECGDPMWLKIPQHGDPPSLRISFAEGSVVEAKAPSHIAIKNSQSRQLAATAGVGRGKPHAQRHSPRTRPPSTIGIGRVWENGEGGGCPWRSRPARRTYHLGHPPLWFEIPTALPSITYRSKRKLKQ